MIPLNKMLADMIYYLGILRWYIWWVFGFFEKPFSLSFQMGYIGEITYWDLIQL